MLRIVRKVTPLICSIALGAVSVGAMTVMAGALAGCEDEGKPEYYIKRLDDPALRPAAVKRLVQFYEDAMTRADKNRDDANVKALTDKVVPPLTKVYMTGNLDDRTRLEVIKLLSDVRDLRAKDAWVKALKDYQPNSTEEEVKVAARAIAKAGVRDPDALDAVIGVFLKLQAGSKKGADVWMDFKDSMLTISSPTWKPQLLERLNRPMEMITPADKDNEAKITAYKNEQFWQVISADILGTIRATDAIKPLYKCVINPNKADVAATAVVALVKMGKEAMPTLNSALLGNDPEILEYTKGFVKNASDVEVTPVRTAALVIGTIGRADGVKSLLVALGKAKDDITRAILARELAKLPASPDSLKAFLEVLSKMPTSVDIPPQGITAVPLLTEALGQFYDPSVIEILVKRGNDAKGSDEDKHVVRDTAMITMIKLMKKDQVEIVSKAVSDWNPKADEAKLEKGLLAQSKKVLAACGDKVECYLAKIEEPAVQEKNDEFSGIKAAYMIGILGNDASRAQMIKRLPRIKNAAVKFSVGQAIDHLAPAGDKAGAEEITKVIEANEKKGDRNVMAGDSALKQIVQRLLARL